MRIMSTAVFPEILQLDNGAEFLGTCIKLINKHFPDVHVVKGRSWHPQSQGGIEHDSALFKEALQKWMQTNNYNGPLGIYYMNAGMNQCLSHVKGNMSPYSIYYGQKVWS